MIVYMHVMFDGKVFQQITYIPVDGSFPSSLVYYFHMKGNLFRWNTILKFHVTV